MIPCLVCGRALRRLGVHLARAHEMSTATYREKYPGAETESLEFRTRLRRVQLVALNTPTAKKRARQSALLAGGRPEVRRRRSEAQKIAHNRPEVIAKKRVSTRRTCNLPSVRERNSEIHSRGIQEGRFHPGRGRKGQFTSKKNGKKVYYASTYELRALQLLETDDRVVSFERGFRIPYVWRDGSSHYYCVDLLVKYITPPWKLIEVKPQWALTHENNPLKFEAARRWCAERGYVFEVWTEEQIGGVK